MREDVEFEAHGATLRGWLYRPDRDGRLPAVVMFPGLSATKEMDLGRYAEAISGAGLAVLLLDNRNFGASGGEPRQELDPWVQVNDYRHAITWLCLRDDIDADRIGVFGIDVSGGHALVVSAIDERVRCAVSVVPLVAGSETLDDLVRPDLLPDLRRRFDRDRAGRLRGEDPAMIAVVSPDPTLPCVSPPQDAWEWFSTTGRARAPAGRNEVTLRSLEMLAEYEPGAYVKQISPTPLLMIVAKGDHLPSTRRAMGVFEEALEPKRLILLEGGHFEVHRSNLDAATQACRWWYAEHLLGG